MRRVKIGAVVVVLIAEVLAALAAVVVLVG